MVSCMYHLIYYKTNVCRQPVLIVISFEVEFTLSSRDDSQSECTGLFKDIRMKKKNQSILTRCTIYSRLTHLNSLLFTIDV